MKAFLPGSSRGKPTFPVALKMRMYRLDDVDGMKDEDEYDDDEDDREEEDDDDDEEDDDEEEDDNDEEEG